MDIENSLKEIKALLLLNHAEIQYLKKRLFEHLNVDDSDPYKYANELHDFLKEIDSKQMQLYKDFQHLAPKVDK